MTQKVQLLFHTVHNIFANMKQRAGNYISTHRQAACHVAGIPDVWWLTLICIFALVAHAPLLFGQFTNYDDGIQITQFRGVTQADSNTVKKLLTTNYEAKNSNPMYLSFVANWWLTPGSYRGFTVFNLMIFVSIVMLFYQFSKRIFEQPIWQLAATAMFAMHSAKAEVIGWMSARCHFLGMPFFLSAFIFWDMYVNAIDGRRKATWYVLSILCAGAAVLNKTVFISVVPLILLFDLYRRRRFHLTLVLDKLPLTAVVLNIFWIGGKVSATTDRSLAKSTIDTVLDRLPSAVNIVSQYVAELFVPGTTSICADAKLPSLNTFFETTDSSSLFMYKLIPISNAAFLLLLVWAAYYIWRRRKESVPFFGILAIGAALLPVLGFVPFWVDFAFRFLWIPIVFFSLIISALLRQMSLHVRGALRVTMWCGFALYLTWHGVQSFVISSNFDTTPKYWKNCMVHFPESQICLQKLVGSSMDLDLKTAVNAQWQLINVATNKKSDHRISGMIMADLLARMGKVHLASLFYERALVWRNARPDELKRAGEYLQKHPVTAETRAMVIKSRWENLW